MLPRPTKGEDGVYRDPKGHVLVPRPGSMYWRGRYLAGLYCETCNSIWDNPEDSLIEAAERSARLGNIDRQ